MPSSDGLSSAYLLVVGVVFVIVSVPVAFIAGIEHCETSYRVTESVVHPNRPVSLVELFESADIYLHNITLLSVTNLNQTTIRFSMICKNETYTIELDAGETEEYEYPPRPCVLISSSTTNVRLKIQFEKRYLPYASLSILSLGLFIAGTALLMTYTGQKIMKHAIV